MGLNLTTRDIFAMRAIQGLLVGVDNPDPRKCASLAYEVAGAMMDLKVAYDLEELPKPHRGE